jgi:hypothetical protein
MAENVAFIGDSLALSIGKHLQHDVYGREKASSCSLARMIKTIPFANYDQVVISAGNYDPPGPCIGALRREISGVRRVVWILPTKNTTRAHVSKIAALYRDLVVAFIGGADGIHPDTVHELARNVKETLNSR